MMNRRGIIIQKDYIILPQSTLKRFRSSICHKIHFIDLNDMEHISIKSIFPKSYHALEGYYDPQFDDFVKKQETSIGKLYKKVTKIVQSREKKQMINRSLLRQQVIDFVTMEFHRAVIANKSMLEKYKIRQQKENDLVDERLLQQGVMTPERAEYSLNYRERAKSNESFRWYAQNILGAQNIVISQLYKNYTAYILYIPDGCDYRFLLPPFHYVANEWFLDLVLSPQIIVALYPPPAEKSLLLIADSVRVRDINLRILESVTVADNGFREIVGEKSQLEALKRRIEQTKNLFKMSNGYILKADDADGIRLRSLDDVMETVVALYLLYGEMEKVIKVHIREKCFTQNIITNNIKEINEWFLRYSFRLVLDNV